MQEKDERIIIDAICRDEGMVCHYTDYSQELDETYSYIPYDEGAGIISQAMHFFRGEKC